MPMRATVLAVAASAEIVTTAQDTFSAMRDTLSSDRDRRIGGIAALIRQGLEPGVRGDRARQLLSDRFGASFFI